MSAKDRLIVALDTPDINRALSMVKLLRDQVGMFKIGLELFIATGGDGVWAIADQIGNNRIFLDLKLNDIPKTICSTLKVISKLPILFTTVCVSRRGKNLYPLRDYISDDLKLLGVLMLTSSEYSVPAEKIIIRIHWAKELGCHGVVCPVSVLTYCQELMHDLITVCPGIRLENTTVSKDDQIMTATPYRAIMKGADYLVIGRPITQAPDPAGVVQHIVNSITHLIN